MPEIRIEHGSGVWYDEEGKMHHNQASGSTTDHPLNLSGKGHVTRVTAPLPNRRTSTPDFEHHHRTTLPTTQISSDSRRSSATCVNPSHLQPRQDLEKRLAMVESTVARMQKRQDDTTAWFQRSLVTSRHEYTAAHDDLLHRIFTLEQSTPRLVDASSEERLNSLAARLEALERGVERDRAGERDALTAREASAKFGADMESRLRALEGQVKEVVASVATHRNCILQVREVYGDLSARYAKLRDRLEGHLREARVQRPSHGVVIENPGHVERYGGGPPPTPSPLSLLEPSEESPLRALERRISLLEKGAAAPTSSLSSLPATQPSEALDDRRATHLATASVSGEETIGAKLTSQLEEMKAELCASVERLRTEIELVRVDNNLELVWVNEYRELIQLREMHDAVAHPSHSHDVGASEDGFRQSRAVKEEGADQNVERRIAKENLRRRRVVSGGGGVGGHTKVGKKRKRRQVSGTGERDS